MAFKFSKELSYDENKNIKIMRRQPYALKNLKKNDVLTEKNIIFVRPHVPVNYTNPQYFIGKRLKKRIFKNELIKKLDVK